MVCLTTFLIGRLESARAEMGTMAATAIVQILAAHFGDARSERGRLKDAALLLAAAASTPQAWTVSPTSGGVLTALAELEEAKASRKRAFHTLAAVHADLRERGVHLPSEAQRAAYAASTPVIAEKPWSQSALQWVQGELRPRDRVLDIGSSFGFLCGSGEYDCVAIDLAPAHSSVWEADFFALALDDSLGSSIRTEGQALRAVGGESFDAVVLSLVLSFLPTAELRREMLLRVRRCLRPTGVLLLVEKASLGKDREHLCQFQAAVEAAGFVAQKHAALAQLEGEKRKQRRHAFAWRFGLAEPRDAEGPRLPSDCVLNQTEQQAQESNDEGLAVHAQRGDDSTSKEQKLQGGLGC